VLGSDLPDQVFRLVERAGAKLKVDIAQSVWRSQWAQLRRCLEGLLCRLAVVAAFIEDAQCRKGGG
jgi:hypothetical protein